MNNKKVIIILSVILLLLISIGTALYINNKKEITKLNEEIEKEEGIIHKEEKEEKEETVVETESVEAETCSERMNASYRGKYSDEKYKEEMTITLKDNGTYEKAIKEGELQKGTYKIANNNITFEFVPSGAPVDAKTSYSYKMSSDCNEITVRNSNFSYTLTKD
jgi:hypothetical protein